VAYILCLETATNTCSVALSQEGHLVAEAHISEGMRHSASLTRLIDKVTKQAKIRADELNAIAISDGPGSYTGLRVGASTAKAICYVQDIPLIAVSTLEGIADTYKRPERTVMATLDARRMEVYAAFYQGTKEIEGVQSVIWDEGYLRKVLGRHIHLSIVGTGVEKAKELFSLHPTVEHKEIECRASFLMAPAYRKYTAEDFVDIAYHSPNYFKRPNITVPKRKI